MQEYPKALYLGDTRCNDLSIANDQQKEDALRERGYVDFYDLPEPEIEVTGTPIEISGISEEEYNQVVRERDAALEILNDVPAMKARIAELQGDTDVDTSKESADYSTWTAEQLREEITKQGKEFKVRDSKAELIAILES